MTKTRKTAKDFKDNPKIRRGPDAAKKSKKEPWEVEYEKAKRRKTKT